VPLFNSIKISGKRKSASLVANPMKKQQRTVRIEEKCNKWILKGEHIDIYHAFGLAKSL
jgi:hypothetical protein